jgi:sec-independent protein translocase protein TatC
MSTSDPSEGPVELEQPFISHLIELRNRLLYMVIAVGVVLVALMPFANDLYSWLAGPLLAAGSKMIATQVSSPFFAPFKLAFAAAIFTAMPFILYQAWSFVAPGLYAHEKRLAIPLLIASVILFYIGVAFAYFVIFPLVFDYFATTKPAGVEVMTDISSYLDFTLSMFLAFGAVFEVPVVTIVLVLLGFVTTESLSEKRPYVIVGIFIVAAILTPPDPISQISMAVPMWALFEAGLLCARILVRFKKESGAPAEDANEDADAMLERYTAEQAALENRSDDPPK